MNRSLLTFSLALFTMLALASSVQAAAPRANLAASKLTATPTTLQVGARIAAAVKVSNGGLATARKTKTFFLLSADDRRSGDDLRLASVSTAKLKVTKSRTVKFSGAIPAETPVGKRFLLACADGTRTVREKSERDNCKSVAITITATPTIAGPTPPAPTGPTGPADSDGDGVLDATDNCASQANPDQVDNDGDGKGNACDACPYNPNPAGAFCPATVYSIKMLSIPTGSNVELSGLVVTGTAGTHAWIQLPVGHPDYMGADHSAIELIFSSAPSITTGDVITVGGEVDDYQRLEVAYSAVTSTQAVPDPTVITGAQLGTDYTGAYDALLIRINNVQSAGPYGETGGWLLHDTYGFGVLPTIYGTLPAQAPGSYTHAYSYIIGVKTWDLAMYVLLPRTAADIGPFGPI